MYGPLPPPQVRCPHLDSVRYGQGGNRVMAKCAQCRLASAGLAAIHQEQLGSRQQINIKAAQSRSKQHLVALEARDAALREVGKPVPLRRGIPNPFDISIEAQNKRDRMARMDVMVAAVVAEAPPQPGGAAGAPPSTKKLPVDLRSKAGKTLRCADARIAATGMQHSDQEEPPNVQHVGARPSAWRAGPARRGDSEADCAG